MNGLFGHSNLCVDKHDIHCLYNRNKSGYDVSSGGIAKEVESAKKEQS